MLFFKKNQAGDAPCACGSPEGGAEEEAVKGCAGIRRCADIGSIAVLGAGCKSCHVLLESAEKAIASMGLDMAVEYITDMQQIMEYGVMSLPALVVNGQVVSVGKTLPPEKVRELLCRYKG